MRKNILKQIYITFYILIRDIPSVCKTSGLTFVALDLVNPEKPNQTISLNY